MKSCSLINSIQEYEKKTGETFEIPLDSAIKIIDDNFMIWKLGLQDGVPFFYINQVYAKSFSIFVPFIKEVCKDAEIEWIVTSTQRPKAHFRKWKMQLVSEYDFEGRHYFVLKSSIDNIK